ncbi:hypothetical protein F4778DRAFT_52817 [Xylariomycetidae sp. FL2044]|nr:hypothetical protein F4778DRAFT_52817 [Xylariomycetidae sp. FL2044]
MAFGQILDRVEADLKSPDSTLRSLETEDVWHSHAAMLLSLPFRRKWPTEIARVKALRCIPVQDLHRWVSIAESFFSVVYFPYVGGFRIPGDLDIWLVKLSATGNPERDQLFIDLGVKTATRNHIKDLICRRYSPQQLRLSAQTPIETHVERSLDHLIFLYLTHDEDQVVPIPLDLAVVTQSHQLLKPRFAEIYFATDHPYEACSLMSGYSSTPAPFFLLHSRYMDALQEKAIQQRSDITWLDWLVKAIGIRRELYLVEGGSLTDTCSWILAQRPDKIVGVLQHCWKHSKAEILGNKAIINKVRVAKVTCVGGSVMPLEKTILPLPYLLSSCDSYLNTRKGVSLLQLDEALEDDPSSWRFLKVFGVTTAESLEFFLYILQELVKTDERSSPAFVDRVYNLYWRLQTNVENSHPDTRFGRAQTVEFTFYNRKYILVPESNIGPQRLESIFSCLWEAPAFMKMFVPLKPILLGAKHKLPQPVEKLAYFFRDTLKIPDCDYDDILQDLRDGWKTGTESTTAIAEVYEYLNQMTYELPPKDIETIRGSFQIDGLIFVPDVDGDAWLRTPECLWASTSRIRGKADVSHHYPDLKHFFVEILRVPTLTFRMVYDELVEKGRGEDVSVDSVRQLIWDLNSFLGSASEPLDAGSKLVGTKVLPVRYANGNIKLCTSGTSFSIADREKYGQFFRNKAKTLAFSVEEVHRLAPFLHWTGLASRFVSTNVREVTTVSEGDTAPFSPTAGILWGKAAALQRYYSLTGLNPYKLTYRCRIAVHYKSPRDDDSLQKLLENTVMFETNGISSELHLLQDNKNLKANVSRSELHIEELEDALEIYVPRDVKGRNVCFHSKLPLRLAEWLMDRKPSEPPVDSSLVNILQSVINADPVAISDILENNGISTDGLVQEELTETASSEALRRTASPSLIVRPSTPQTSSQISTPTTPRTSYSVAGPVTPSSFSLSRSIPSQSLFGRPSTPSVTRSPSPAPWTPPANTQGHAPFGRRSPQGTPNPQAHLGALPYTELLTKVVDFARRATIPTWGAFDLSSLLDALPDGEDAEMTTTRLGLRTAGQLERDKMVGAAGELYAFELLSHLRPALPGFSLASWQSTIRHYVAAHPDYRTLPAWSGRETADITYDDVGGVFTELLIEKGYLSGQAWGGRRPKYFIEVKTTTGPCETPFYMSKGQYKRVSDPSPYISSRF